MRLLDFRSFIVGAVVAAVLGGILLAAGTYTGVIDWPGILDNTNAYVPSTPGPTLTNGPTLPAPSPVASIPAPQAVSPITEPLWPMSAVIIGYVTKRVEPFRIGWVYRFRIVGGDDDITLYDPENILDGMLVVELRTVIDEGGNYTACEARDLGGFENGTKIPQGDWIVVEDVGQCLR